MPVPTQSAAAPAVRLRQPDAAIATAAIENADPTAGRTATPTATLMPLPVVTPMAYDHGAQSVLIQADLSGGAEHTQADAHVTTWRLYGDGFVVLAGDPAPLSAGLDATVRTGHLSEVEVAGLIAFLDQIGFYTLDSYYQPKPAPADAATARISVYASHPKSVSVYAPDASDAPPAFDEAWARITRTIPSDVQTFVPTDAYLESTPAGGVTNFADRSSLVAWTLTAPRLADAINGATISGSTYSQLAALVAQQPTDPLYRDGNQVYRVRFAPNIPRAVHLTDWLGTILDAPREFDGRTFEIVGYYRGANLFGEASGDPPVAKGAWVIVDDGGAMFVTGIAPPRLNSASRADAWSLLKLDARVVYVRLGTSYLEARRVQVLSNTALTPTPAATPASTRTATASTTPIASATNQADAATPSPAVVTETPAQ